MPADVPLIGLAHGSRHPGVTASVTGLLGAAARLGGVPTAAAFLDLTAPDLETSAADLVAQGFRRAVVVPLLFTSAFHATVDVPGAVAAASTATGLDLVVADILGTGDDLLAALRQCMQSAGIDDHSPALLFSVGSSDSSANAAVEDLAARLAATRAGEVRVAFGTRPPRPETVLADLGQPAALVPLFVSPGLLLDPLISLAEQRRLIIAPPLGELVVPLVLHRYAAALD